MAVHRECRVVSGAADGPVQAWCWVCGGRKPFLRFAYRRKANRRFQCDLLSDWVASSVGSWRWGCWSKCASSRAASPGGCASHIGQVRGMHWLALCGCDLGGLWGFSLEAWGRLPTWVPNYHQGSHLLHHCLAQERCGETELSGVEIGVLGGPGASGPLPTRHFRHV